MKWEISKEEGKVRTYRNERTGSEIQTHVIYTDIFGNDWYAFKDLFKLPMLRIVYSKQVADFFNTGVTPEDLDKWDEEELRLLKSDDPEKYEKLYAVVLERRRLRKSIVDPIQQHLSLCAVYVMFPDERIDYFDMATIARKMTIWKGDTDAVAFFLSWHSRHIEHCIDSLKSTSQIALKPKS